MKRPDLVERYEELDRNGAYVKPAQLAVCSRRGCPGGAGLGARLSASSSAGGRASGARAAAAEAGGGASEEPVLRRS